MLISFGDKNLHLKCSMLTLSEAEPMTVGLRRDSLNIVHKMRTLHCLLNLLH